MTNPQLSIYYMIAARQRINLPEGEHEKIEQETQQAIQKGWDGAKVAWRKMVLEIIYETCLQYPQFTTNDFRNRVKAAEQATGIFTHDNRAMGGASSTAKSFGWIEPTGQSIKSRVGHKSPLQIWRSLLYKSPSSNA